MQRAALVLVLTLAASVAAAQERQWAARLQGGSATIHDWGSSGVWAQAQVGRSFAGRVLSADLGLAVSGSDEGYASLTAGLERAPLPQGRRLAVRTR